LIKSLRLLDAPKLALIGAGGKTTAMLRLASEMLERRRKKNLIPTVILFSTYPFLPENISMVDKHINVNEETEIQFLFKNLPTGIIALTGMSSSKDRTIMKYSRIINSVHSLAEKFSLPLFLELDNSNQRAIKIPDELDQIIPHWVDKTVILAGLKSIGKPITSKWVHRPESIADISNQQIGSTIDENTFSMIFNHPKIGYTSIPDKSKKICILNQADNKELLDTSIRISKKIIPRYSSVITASLMPDSKKNILDPYQDEIKYVYETTAGVILAAGSAERMGALKQTLPVNGVPSIKLVASATIKSGLSPVLVVTGAENDTVEHQIEGMNVQIVFNPDWRDGMSTSIKAAIRSLPPETSSAVFMLCDQPLIPIPLIHELVETSAKTLAPIIAPYFGEVRGNPVLFDKTTFEDLLRITGDVGGRAIFSKYPIRKVKWDDHSSFFDMDTPEDYEKIKSFAKKQNKL
jgi:molybdenum cofactor cytidylyltransferase